MPSALAAPLPAARERAVAARRTKRPEVGRWEKQALGPYAPWTKIQTLLDSNRDAGRVPNTVTHLHGKDYLGVSKQTPRNWKHEGRLPPVLFCRWLAEQMGLTIEQFLDPNHPYGKPAAPEERGEDALRRAVGEEDWPGFVDGVKRNPALAKLVAALAGTSRRPPPAPSR